MGAELCGSSCEGYEQLEELKTQPSLTGTGADFGKKKQTAQTTTAQTFLVELLYLYFLLSSFFLQTNPTMRKYFSVKSEVADGNPVFFNVVLACSYFTVHCSHPGASLASVLSTKPL